MTGACPVDAVEPNFPWPGSHCSDLGTLVCIVPKYGMYCNPDMGILCKIFPTSESFAYLPASKARKKPADAGSGLVRSTKLCVAFVFRGFPFLIDVHRLCFDHPFPPVRKGSELLWSDVLEWPQ